MSEPTAVPAPIPKRRRRRTLRILGIVAILLVVLILAGPWTVAHTGLRDPAMNAIIESPSVTASSESASFSWFSPLSVHGLHLISTNHHIEIDVVDSAAERAPLQLWSTAPDLGTIRVEKPHVLLELPLDVYLQEAGHRLEPTFTAIVTDASLTVRRTGQDEPVIDVDGINMTFRVERAAEGRVLTLDPVDIFDRRKLSPKLANSLLQLFDPSLSGAPQVSGEISLSLDKLRIPLGIPRDETVKRMEVKGKLVLHHVTTQVRNPLRQALVQLVADMNGQDASNVVRLAEDAEIRFEVRDGRLHHEGLRIGFPDIDPELQLTSHGSVGLDKTLDLFVELPRLDKTTRQEKSPAKCRITGTIDNPKVSVEDASLVLRQPKREEPIIKVDGINLNMRVENTDSGRVLAVEPVEVFKKKKLSLGVASGLVKLLAPDVEGERQVNGEISLSLNKLRIPLGVTRDEAVQRLEAEGQLTLHQVATEVKSPLWQALIKMLADMNGQEPSNKIHLVEESEIRFQVRAGRLHYDGLRVGFPGIDPDLSVSSHGSVGSDETLDIHLELPRLRKEKRDKGPAHCHITGTISEPKFAMPDASLVVQLTEGDKALLTVDDVRLSFGVESAKEGRMLTLAPVTVFEKQQLTPEVADRLLHLITPTLADIGGVHGEISLSFETFRVPLGVPKDEFAKKVELAGQLQLHQISVSTKTPLIETTVKLLADLYGKKPSDVVRVVENVVVHFQVREGRMYHEGLRIGFPDISPDLLINSRGSVGLDNSLDLMLEIPRINLKDPKAKPQPPVRFRVTGTIDKPVVTELREQKDG